MFLTLLSQCPFPSTPTGLLPLACPYPALCNLPAPARAVAPARNTLPLPTGPTSLPACFFLSLQVLAETSLPPGSPPGFAPPQPRLWGHSACVLCLRALLPCHNCQQPHQPLPLDSKLPDGQEHDCFAHTYVPHKWECGCTEPDQQNSLRKTGMDRGSMGLFKKSGSPDTDPGKDPGTTRNRH